MEAEIKFEQELAEEDKPPSIFPRPAKSWRVAVIANVKGETAIPIDGPTHRRRSGVRPTGNNRCHPGSDYSVASPSLPADEHCRMRYGMHNPISASILPGINGDGQEAQGFTALLELLGIPYTA